MHKFQAARLIFFIQKWNGKNKKWNCSFAMQNIKIMVREVDAMIDLTNAEAESILKNANFRMEEEILFKARYCGPYRLTMEECAEELSVSLSTAKRINARIKKKIMRLN